MKFLSYLAAVSIVLPLASALTVPEVDLSARHLRRANGGFGKGGFNKGGNAAAKGGAAAAKGGNNNAAAASSAAATVAASSAAAAATSAAASSSNSGDAQTSLTLDPSVIATGFEQDGQSPPVAGQTASITSSNNFINFCIGQTITNGKQLTGGSCNPAPIGQIPSTSNMPSAKFVSPPNGGTVQANTEFTITMALNNMQAGVFTNAQANYFAAPQQLNSAGQIIGHTHVVVELLDSLTQTTPTNPNVFAFFKGIDGAQVNGVVTADVTAGVPAGAYRLCSINSSSNHQPAIVPIAQHGSLDDCVYFTATDSGAADSSAAATDTATAAATDAATAAATAAATSAAAAATSAAAGGKGAAAKGGAAKGAAKGGKGRGRFGRDF